MQRYHTASCTSAVNNNTIGGASGRDTTRADSSSLSANFSINSRRQPSLIAYKLKCDKETLNSRLGPPDFYPQTPNCPEETLNREYVQQGYRETVEGLEEAREITLTQVQAFTKPVVLKCREAIRKCLRAINESRAQKRKAGQVYGVPLSGSLLNKPSLFPEQRACGEDFKKKWVEGLSQPHKRLRSLADHVPHGYRKKALFEVLIGNNVPLLRATWFIKVTYLNQLRPSYTNTSGASDKNQLSRTEQWTKDVVEYLQYLLDEFLSRNHFHAVPQTRDRSQKMLYATSVQQKNDPAPAVLDGEEPSLHFKWWYIVQLIHWHQAEGLLLPSMIIDWVLNQLQEKDLLEILQLLLPIIYGVLETVTLSQTYVHSLVGIAVRFIREPSPGGSDLVDNSRRAYTSSALIEMLRYLILAVPDTFVALDCFPLPLSVVSYAVNDGALVSKANEEARKPKDKSEDVFLFRSKGLDAQYQSLSFDQVILSIKKRADCLAKAASPGNLVCSAAKAVQALDKSLSLGDVRGAYTFLFDNICEGAVNECWIEDVGPCLRSSLKWIGTAKLSFVCSVFFLCEWATCDYRDFRTAPVYDLKFTGKKDFSQVHIASQILKLKLKELHNQPQCKNGRSNSVAKGHGHHGYFGRVAMGKEYETNSYPESAVGKHSSSSDIFESPGPLHDVIVCWIDQHEVHGREGLERLQLLIMELICCGIFYPQAYARQLIISGIMDESGPIADLDRRTRHHRVLKHLPGPFIQDVLAEAGIGEGSQCLEVYSNERRLLLHGLLGDKYVHYVQSNITVQKRKIIPTYGKDGASAPTVDQWKIAQAHPSNSTSKKVKSGAVIGELKASISALLRLPNCSSTTSSEVGLDESQGSTKRPAEPSLDGTHGCEDCRKIKRQKLSEDRSSCIQGHSPVSDDEDTWWLRKGSRSSDSLKIDSSKIDPPLKLSKQVTKGRQKVVRKTQSLAQLAAARIEGSQGASTSHVCHNKVGCSHHRAVLDGESLKLVDGLKSAHGGDILSIGKALRRLRFVEKRSITRWLITVVKQLVEETERKVVKANQYTRTFVPVDDKSSIRWRLGEDELSSILYLMDTCNDLASASNLLLWLLPKAPSNPNSTMHSGRNIMMLPRNVENQACEVGEAYLLSALRRYENILLAKDLIPEVLSAALKRVGSLLATNGRISGSAALMYSRYLLKKYGNLPGVLELEKTFKATLDKRLLSELECGRLPDGEFGFPLGVPPGVEDLDEFLRQKISTSRLSRVGMSMRDVVQRHVDDTFQIFFSKERKMFGAGTPKSPVFEKSDDGYQVAQQIIIGLMDCIRQTGGAAQEGDPSLVSSAVSAIVNNIGPTMAKIPDFNVGSNCSNASSIMGPLGFARRILRIHINCLCLLKEALGERQNRVFEIALAAEACTALASAFTPAKASRNQFQLSPESHDSSVSISGEILNNSAKAVVGRGAKCAAAISALVIGAVIHGVTSLERLVTVFRLNDGLDVIQFVKSTKSNSNGSARSVGAFKVDNLIEVYVHWFRVLIGNCRTVSDGLIVELLGEPSIVALSRMQRMLPLNLVFPPAYSIFSFVVWRPIILNNNLGAREDIHQLFQSLTTAIGDAIKHLPFRDVCLRDSRGFYDLLAADTSDAEFASILQLNGLDMHRKSMAFVLLRGRMFLNAIIDCKMPHSIFPHDDGNRASTHLSKVQPAENETKLKEKLVNVLDTLQPAKFHWQWVELRLLLNEQTVIEKVNHDMSLADAIRSSSCGSDKGTASENENNFIEIILTRLLVRPDAASLFSELVHLFGRSLEDSMLLQVKWFLGGQDVLFGRKTIRQRLVNIAESNGLSTKAQFWKPWGWCKSSFDSIANKGDKKKLEVTSLEEGEVVEEGMDPKKPGKGLSQMSLGFDICQQHVTERALVELVLPCIDQGSDESRNTFASDLIKQLNNIEQQISAVTRGVSKQSGASSGLEGPSSKGNSRKVIRGGSPGLAKRTSGAADSAAPSSSAALRASISLRLQLLLRLLPVIWTDEKKDPSGRNMRHVLASVILRLLGNRIVHEDAELSFFPTQTSHPKRELELQMEAVSVDLCGGSLFDRLLLVLHALLSSCQPSWLKTRSASKSISESSKDSPALDREVETLQGDLDRMQLPGNIRSRIQAAMPILLPYARCSISCQPPSAPVSAIVSLQPSVAVSGLPTGNQSQKNPIPTGRNASNVPSKSKALPPPQDNDLEIDPWTLLEDGTGSGPSSSSTAANSSDNANLRASSWLKGTVRVRRTELTYIGAIDDDS